MPNGFIQRNDIAQKSNGDYVNTWQERADNDNRARLYVGGVGRP